MYPGETQLKFSRRESIYKSIESFESFGPYSKDILTEEIASINSFFNFEATLQERRKTLYKKCADVVRYLGEKAQRNKEAVGRSDQLLLEKDRPMRMLLEYDNGVLVGAREG